MEDEKAKTFMDNSEGFTWAFGLEFNEFKEPCELFCLRASVFWEKQKKKKIGGCRGFSIDLLEPLIYLGLWLRGVKDLQSSLASLRHGD